MIIPWQQISPDALNSIIEEFVMREGTDYGESEISFEQKKLEVKQQLNSGSIVLVYSELHETVNLMAANDFKG
ncbi:YheU family protein [Psychrosphaera aquimarina]|uniref:YheU family protein n=1 Tax=Psychrosphaera aquimarina TaxID=2044854 RepID=A0ABU3QYG3_9GAMM|nr:YheU family protein [Psychrosphaera aquimarina]MDU0112471.1 YheU family protein [Psychrosphaera aquimarina]